MKVSVREATDASTDAFADGGRTNWIQKAVPASHKGRLHRALDVPEGEKIPASKLAKAASSDNPHMRKMANFAKTMKGLG